MKTVIVSAAALVDKDKRILVAKRPNGKHMEGMWEFPGGKLESDETPQKALVRELREELGVKITLKDLKQINFTYHSYDDFNLIMLLYGCSRWYGNPKAIEHSELKWTYIDSLHRLNMPPADEPLLEPLRHFINSL